MKPLIRPALPLLIAAALAACGKEEAKPAALSCQAPEAIGQLTDQIQAAVSPVQESGLPYFESGASEVQAAFGQLGFEITDIRTTQAASEGSKTLSCEATLRLAPKPEAQTRIKQSIENRACNEVLCKHLNRIPLRNIIINTAPNTIKEFFKS